MQTARQAKSIHTEAPIANTETHRSFVLLLENPFPAIGSAWLAPKLAARTRLQMSIENDTISEIAKGLSAHPAISNCGQKSPKAMSAVPV